MALVLAVIALVALVICYFCLGFVLKFLWAWWPMTIGMPLLLAVGFGFGWIGAAIAIFGFFALISGNNDWHDTALYLAGERRIDGMFYLSDT